MGLKWKVAKRLFKLVLKKSQMRQTRKELAGSSLRIRLRIYEMDTEES